MRNRFADRASNLVLFAGHERRPGPSLAMRRKARTAERRILGDRVFFDTDNAHLICLNRLTGGLMWDVFMPEAAEPLWLDCAPLVVGDLVISASQVATKEFAGLSLRTK